jgi:folate-binding protein YgfZ
MIRQSITTAGTASNLRRETFAFDVSKRALLRLSGPDALDLLHRISTNDLAKLSVGASAQTILTTEKGRIVDVLSVLRLSDTELLLAGCSDDTQRLASWIQKFIIMENAKIEDTSASYRQLLIKSVNPLLVKKLAYGSSNRIFAILEKLGPREWIRLIFYDHDSNVSTFLAEMNYQMMDHSDYEWQRITDGIPAVPNELNENTNPHEVNLTHLVSFTKGCYVGQEVIARLETYHKVQRKLSRVSLSAVPSELPAPIRNNDSQIGHVTSVASKGKETIGLAFLPTTIETLGGRVGYVENSIEVREWGS